MSRLTDIATRLAENIHFNPYKSKSGVLQFCNGQPSADTFADIFGIGEDQDVKRFRSAFDIVTGGVGGELKKINSLYSSSLLGLTTFYPMFGNKSDSATPKIEIGGTTFDSCLFEVRNMAIVPRWPSCVDIMLKSGEEHLFLESKLCEPIRDKKSDLPLALSYKTLYKGTIIESVLKDNKITVADDGGNLHVDAGGEVYLYGIKQVICHLIGLMRGPRIYDGDRPGYPADYYEGWSDDSKLTFGTILYDTGDPEIREYMDLFNSIFVDHKAEIIRCIREWLVKERLSLKPSANIDIISALTYQEVFKKQNPKFLLSRVANFYNLNENSSLI